MNFLEAKIKCQLPEANFPLLISEQPLSWIHLTPPTPHPSQIMGKNMFFNSTMNGGKSQEAYKIWEPTHDIHLR